MRWHGHAKADFRNLELHRVALEKLRGHPELLAPVLALLGRWLNEEAQRPAWPYLRKWREMLSDWPFEKMVGLLLDEVEGQVYRQCSPLGPVLSPGERWAAFQEADQRLRAVAAEAAP